MNVFDYKCPICRRKLDFYSMNGKHRVSCPICNIEGYSHETIGLAYLNFTRQIPDQVYLNKILMELERYNGIIDDEESESQS